MERKKAATCATFCCLGLRNKSFLLVEAVEPLVDGAVNLGAVFAVTFALVLVVARCRLVVVVGGQFTRFHEVDGIVEALGNLLEVFLVEENLVLLVEELVGILVKATLALGYGDVLLVIFRCLDVEKIRPLTCFHGF